MLFLLQLMPLVWVALTDLGFWTPLAFSTKLYLFVVSHPNLTKVLSCYSKRYIVSEIEHEHHLLIFFKHWNYRRIVLCYFFYLLTCRVFYFFYWLLLLLVDLQGLLNLHCCLIQIEQPCLQKCKNLVVLYCMCHPFSFTLPFVPLLLLDLGW